MDFNGQILAPAALPRRKSPPVGLAGPQNRSGHCEEEKNLALLGIEPGAVHPVARSYPDLYLFI
jgi:hypothetical protein